MLVITEVGDFCATNVEDVVNPCPFGRYVTGWGIFSQLEMYAEYAGLDRCSSVMKVLVTGWLRFDQCRWLKSPPTIWEQSGAESYWACSIWVIIVLCH